MKSLVKDYNKRGRYFEKTALNDTIFTKVLKRIITKEKDWRNQYYAISLIPAINDSSKELLLESFSRSKNPHLRLRAYAIMAKLNSRRIPEFLRSEKRWVLKGELLKLLAKSQPSVTYGMIMENLDQGTDEFKIKLLQALNIINDRMSRQAIKQFLNVDNPRLTNASFDILKKRGRIKSDDIEMLINSDAVSTVSTVIEWQTARKKAIKSDQLLAIYSKFKKPKSFDLQADILKNLQLKKKNPAKKEIEFLYRNAANRQIVEKLNQWLSIKNDTLSTFILPASLLPDSIVSKNEKAIIYIKTVKGLIKAELYQHEAPLTVFNFLLLVKKGFYDGLTFHRVVADFVVQGGDPQGDGWGDPGYIIPSEDNEMSFKRGSIGMATSGFDSGGCQFFICQSVQPNLDGNYTLFGDVIAGMDVVDTLLPDDKIINITVRKE
jgi:peptidyl-prolyl cis-trans isomerase B (cyclophilin B)